MTLQSCVSHLNDTLGQEPAQTILRIQCADGEEAQTPLCKDGQVCLANLHKLSSAAYLSALICPAGLRFLDHPGVSNLAQRRDDNRSQLMRSPTPFSMDMHAP